MTIPHPVPVDDRADYEPDPCPNGHPTRVLTWSQPAGMTDHAIPTATGCDECGWRSADDNEPAEVPIP